ncbi:hypothetical protein EMCRGX_G000792 [Ephydatia muelleri]
MNSENTIQMEVVRGEGGPLQSSFSELDGKNACLEQCPQEFRSKYRACCEEIKNGSLQANTLNDFIYQKASAAMSLILWMWPKK